MFAPHKLGQFFVVAVALSAVFSFLSTLNNGLAANLSSQVVVPYTNYLPEVSNILINSGNPINLTSNTTTQVTVSASIIDQNGCSDIDLSSSYLLLYRSGYTSSTCATSQNYNRSCYRASITQTSSCISATQINVTGTIPLWYFADATDASSSFSTQDWRATLVAYDNWGRTTDLPYAVAFHPSFIHNNYVYVVGGLVSAATSTVLYAPISENGTIESWATTTPMPNALAYHSSFSNNNYIYLVGGFDSSYNPTSTVRYATINSSGTIGAWTETTPMPSSLTSNSSFVHNNRVYVIGGYSGGSTTSTVRYATINSSGTIGSWVNTTPLPSATANHPSFVHNNYVYVVGGFDDSDSTSTVLYAPINSSGTIGSWATTTPLPSVLSDHSSFVYNDRLYVVGGYDVSLNPTSNVRYATINSSGTIGAWTETTPMPSSLYRHRSFIYNNRLYVDGGLDASDKVPTVLSAPINSDGSIPYWGQGRNAVSSPSGVVLNTLLAITTATSTIDYGTVNPNTNTGSTNQELGIINTGNATYTLNISGTALSSGGNSIPTSSQHFASNTFTYGGSEEQLASTPINLSGVSVGSGIITGSGFATTTPLPSALYSHSSFVHNNRVYAVGGSNEFGVPTSTVLFASINSSGAIGAWATTTPLPSTRTTNTSFVHNNRVYAVAGGIDYSPWSTSTVLFASINSSGTIGAWATTTPLPSRLSNHSSFAFNNYAYVVGGYDDSSNNSTSTVLYAPTNSSGTIGSWATTTPLPAGLHANPSFVHSNRVYVVGGSNYATGPTSTVLYAPINSSGTIGAWTNTTPLPYVLSAHPSFVHNNRVYVAGGYSQSSEISTVIFTAINNNGTLNSWVAIPSLPSPINSHSFFASNNRAYVIGGEGGVATSTVLYANLDSNSTHWGLSVPDGSAIGTYSGVNTITAVYSP